MLKPVLKINFQSFPQSMSSAVSSGVTEALQTEKNPLRRERERKSYVQTEKQGKQESSMREKKLRMRGRYRERKKQRNNEHLSTSKHKKEDGQVKFKSS